MAGAFVAALTLVACSPDSYDSPNLKAIPVASDYEENVTVTVDQETNYAYFNFRSAPGVTPVWIIDGTSYTGEFTAKKYYRKAGEYSVECKVKNANGISDGSIIRTFTIDKTKMNGFSGFDAESEDNLFKTATVTKANTFYAVGGDWHDPGQPLNVTVTGAGDINVFVPVGTEQRWQCQIPFETTISTVAQDDVTYDFSCVITSNNAFTAMVKFTNPNDDNDFYFAEEQKLPAGEPICFYMTEMPSRSIENLKLFFDFGTCPDGTEVVIENLVFIEHSKNAIVAPEKGEPEPVWREAENLWTAANPTLGSTFYATGSDWRDPGQPLGVTVNNGVINVQIPVYTEARWQCQVPFDTEIGISDADVEYDFLAVIESNNEFTAMVKLTDASDDDNYLFAEEKKLYAGGETRFVVAQAKIPRACDKLKLFFDFGTCPANTEITISKIILQTHKD